MSETTRKWEIDVWMRGCEHESTLEVEGTYADALRAAEERCQDIRGDRDAVGEVDFDIRPADVLHESVPRGWRVDEERGELVPRSRIVDPLPHAAVRVWKGGNVSTILERGLQRSRPAVAVIARVVPKHLGSEKRLNEHAVEACRLELEDDLGRLAARRVFIAQPDDGPSGRIWT